MFSYNLKASIKAFAKSDETMRDNIGVSKRTTDEIDAAVPADTLVDDGALHLIRYSRLPKYIHLITTVLPNRQSQPTI